MSRPKTIEEMNKKVVEIMEEIEKEEYFECLNDVDTQMKHHPECNDKIFYQMNIVPKNSLNLNSTKK